MTEDTHAIEAAARRGDVRAQVQLALIYSEGKGLPQNHSESANWFRKAAEQGDAPSQYNLGWHFTNGKGVSEDALEAFRWYQRSAVQGFVHAQYSLATSYYFGRGIERSYSKAFEWYLKAAEQDHLDSQAAIGLMCYNGDGVPQNYKTAARWTLKAASRGHASSQHRMAWICANGFGVHTDIGQAIMWCRKAAAQDLPAAKKYLVELERTLHPTSAPPLGPSAQESSPRDRPKARSPEEVLCILCSNPSVGGTMLTNGTAYHTQCYQRILSAIEESQRKRSSLGSQISAHEQTIYEAESLSYKVKVFFFGNSVNVSAIRSSVRALSAQRTTIEKQIEERNATLAALYDHWPEIPPDMDQRRRAVAARADGNCEQCGAHRSEKHVHHIVPIARGGSHLLSNLAYLCLSCHMKSHHGRDISVRDRTSLSPGHTVFAERMKTIKSAMDSRKLISFRYTKYDGAKSIRTIAPHQLLRVEDTLCIQGHCYLRNEDRVFAIKRMESIQLADRPSKCCELSPPRSGSRSKSRRTGAPRRYRC